MDLTVSNEITGNITGPLDVSDDMALGDFLALLEIDCGFDLKKHDLYHNMDILDKNKLATSLKELGLSRGDLLLIRNKIGNEPVTDVTELSDDEFIEQFRNELLHNEMLRNSIGARIPMFLEMINNPQLFKERLGPIILQRRYSSGMGGGNIAAQNTFGIPQEEYNRLMSNPEDPDNKKRITELTNQQDIDEQMRNALEYTPEVFTTVSMLYIDLEINGTAVKAFVDTGAQMTILSTKLAKKTGLDRLIDKRFTGEAHGVGVGKIHGRIHQAQIKIETQFIPCSFTVLDTPMDLLIGLDMLKRHQANVDLEKNVLRIAGVETKFLGEADIPKDFAPENSITMKEKPKEKKILKPSKKIITTINPQSSSNIGSVSTSAQPVTSAPKKYSDETIRQLTNLGFSRAEALKALDQTNGNVEFAASLLFQ
ncbi:hypothetical protein TPHA_0D04300 [Tetrapisispora phaffii CBS 4417]|uniref:DNA damage-inducible protein 1 n=1 Tax=Tetrapisispora phaffii (strain ATCC 24235 / CBS 4417 / NBRC 1672 / NRRL Y-8282 / UCD 70-5) TaxID=1071381 RepID=G8BRY9_TETPH|nr:hypothetical protein TPHA_0D04300 [Tetrapisispora phaffii CBS 4417]CCE63064.1 hypothetical protein TPHA_0D04300 [Tetrapisispora phaffii CBS 4417]